MMKQILPLLALTILIACSPKTARHYTELGHRQLKKSDMKLSESSYKKAIEIDSLYTDAYIALGQLYMNNQDFQDKGLNYFDKALSQDSKSFEAWNGKGYIFLQQKKYQEAIDNFSKAIDINQADKIVYYQRGYARYYLSDTLYIGDFKKSCDLGNNSACETLHTLATGK
jgi:tetratricopeptide (TPR) repeat protein